MSLGFHVPPDAFAADGDVTSTVEINSSTANGPLLDDVDIFGKSVANIGDLDGDGVNDLPVDAQMEMVSEEVTEAQLTFCTWWEYRL
jgi:hypothetical protein